MISIGCRGRENSPSEPKARLVRDASPYLKVTIGLLLGCAAFHSARAVDTPPARVDVLYFHRTLRCPGCLDMEAFAAEAVARFPAERDAGRLTWRVINLDEPGQRHFEQDYALEFNSVVLSRRANSQETAWTNLPSVWPLVGDRSNFVAYVEMEIATQLGQISSANTNTP